ncbi:hypothetical protein [Nocardia testacea]|uniref:hypothetical protein n=1 Tax=Nocardia testacea TaxID=248551 RepID=UPI0005849486|nr:hypothetical protein [Nocardia testacea]
MQGKPWVERVITGVDGDGKPTTKLYAYLPYQGRSNEPWIRATLGRIHLKPVHRDGLKMWELSSKHMLPLARAMADRYGEIEMRLHTSATMEDCTHSCQNAYAHTVWECVCICGGEHHGGKGQYSDWYSTGRWRIRRRGDIEVRYVTITRGQLRDPHNPQTEPAEAPTASEQPPRQEIRPEPTVLPPAQAPVAPDTPRPEPHHIVHSAPAAARTPASAPAIRVPVRSSRWQAFAAAVMVVVLGGGIWSIQQQDNKDAAVSDQETVQPAPADPEVAHVMSVAPPAPAPTDYPARTPAPEEHPCWPFVAAC